MKKLLLLLFLFIVSMFAFSEIAFSAWLRPPLPPSSTIEIQLLDGVGNGNNLNGQTVLADRGDVLSFIATLRIGDKISPFPISGLTWSFENSMGSPWLPPRPPLVPSMLSITPNGSIVSRGRLTLSSCEQVATPIRLNASVLNSGANAHVYIDVHAPTIRLSLPNSPQEQVQAPLEISRNYSTQVVATLVSGVPNRGEIVSSGLTVNFAESDSSTGSTPSGSTAILIPDTNMIAIDVNENESLETLILTVVDSRSGATTSLDIVVPPVLSYRLADIFECEGVARAVAEVLDVDIESVVEFSDLDGITELWLEGDEVFGLAGIELLTNLKDLELWSTQIRDISPLGSLVNLRYLFLGDNEIDDISPLSSLTKLFGLGLDNNEIKDITPLSSLTNLEVLLLIESQIRDITPLSGLTQLEILKLWDTQISDITPLLPLVNLISLNLWNNEINDISSLSTAIFPHLESLALDDNKIMDISSLSSSTMPNLTSLWLDYNQISDISPLATATMPNLEFLFLSNNEINDLNPLSTANFPNLFELSLSDNQISDLRPLRNFNLEWLSASSQIIHLPPTNLGTATNLNLFLTDGTTVDLDASGNNFSFFDQLLNWAEIGDNTASWSRALDDLELEGWFSGTIYQTVR